MKTTRITLVLGSGGFRGPAHIGVLERLREIGVPIYAMIGCSVGSLVTAYHAAVGMSIDGLMDAAFGTDALGVLSHALSIRFRGITGCVLGRWAGVVHARLEILNHHDFRHLHHGVRKVGFLVHDLRRGERIFAVTGRERGLTLSEAVRASSRHPVLFPPLRKEVEGLERKLVDGALSAPTPILHAIAAPVSATHVVAVDLTGSWRRGRFSELRRWRALLGGRLLVVRPRPRFPALRRGAASFVRAWYDAGRQSIGPIEEGLLRDWLRPAATLPAATVPAMLRLSGTRSVGQESGHLLDGDVST